MLGVLTLMGDHFCKILARIYSMCTIVGMIKRWDLERWFCGAADWLGLISMLHVCLNPDGECEHAQCSRQAIFVSPVVNTSSKAWAYRNKGFTMRSGTTQMKTHTRR